MKEFIGVILLAASPFIGLIFLVEYSSQYSTISPTKAEKGIIWKEQIDLTKYDVIGEGNNLMCGNKGHIKYTRSINHEAIKVCKQ